MRCGASLRAGRREGVGWRRRKRHARGRPESRLLGGQGTRGAHQEHVAHGRDLGGVKAQRLVKRARVLPSRREGHAMRGEVRAGRREGMRRRRRKRHARGKARLKAVGGQGTRGAHVEHVVHVRDLGGVKAQRLVEGVRALPSRREGHAMRGEVARREAGGREAVAAQAACTGEGPNQGCWGPGHARSAHCEHAPHVRDLGGVKAQRLIERARVLPSRREGHAMRGEVRAGRREGVRWRRRKRHARGKARLKAVGGQGTRGAHLEHAAHVRDLGGVKAQRLVEGVRVLPSRRGRVRCGVRCGLGGPGGRGAAAAQAACSGKARLKAVGGAGHARSARRT